MLVISVLGRWRQEDIEDLPASQLSLIDKFRFSERKLLGSEAESE